MADALNVLTPSSVVCVNVIGEHKLLKDVGINQIRLSVVGNIFRRVERQGKWLLLRFDQPNRLSTICIHNSMHGHIFLAPEEDYVSHKHDRFVIVVESFSRSGGQAVILYRDMRCWGQIRFFTDDEETPKFLQKLGHDPLNGYIGGDELYAIYKKYPHGSMGDLLLRQDLVAGIGNIYRSEILHRARILPTRWVEEVTVSEWSHLAVSIHDILRVAHIMGGSSVADFVGPTGETGRAQNGHLVYARGGQPCLSCKQGEIKVELMSKRKVFFCSSCQY